MAPDKASQKEEIPPALPPVVRKSLEAGLITLSAVSENRRPMTSVSESLNFDFDTIGSAKVRLGITQLGNTLTGAILGMHYFVNNLTPSQTQMIVVNATSAYYLSGASFVSIRTGLTAGSKARFCTYLSFEFMVNGTEATAVWDGSTSGSFVTTGNAASAPTGTLIENFRSRVWISGNTTYPDRLYYSSIPSSVTTPIITWNTSVSTGQWIDIAPSDGESVTGIKRARNTMLVFKTNHIYRVFDIGQTDPDPYYAVGTSSMESVLETKVGVFFHHSSGFYQYDIYGVVQEISRPIIDIVKAIPVSSYASVTGWVDASGDRLNWSVGTVSVNGQTFTNLVVRYTISTKTWTHRTYPSQFVMSISRQPFYNDGTTQFTLGGTSDGKVFKIDSGLTDDGAAIPYSLIHSWDNADGLLSSRKNIQNALFSHYGGAGANVNVQTDANEPDGLKDWGKPIGQLGTFNTGFNSANVKGRKFRFRISGQSKGETFTYNGYELVGVTNELMQFPKNPAQ